VPTPAPRSALNTGQFAVIAIGSDPDLDETDPAQALRIAKRSLRIGKEVRQSVGRPAGTNSDGTSYEASGMWKQMGDGFAAVGRQLTELRAEQGPKLDRALAFIEQAEAARASRGSTVRDIALSLTKGLLLMVCGAALTALWARLAH
jgi:hypothetical protein